MGQAEVNKIFLLAIGCYLFMALAQVETSPAHAHGFIELAFRKLATIDLQALHVGEPGQDPTFAALAFQP